MSITSVQLDRALVEQVKEIARSKFPLRNINSYAEATREALIEFVNKNKKYCNQDSNQDQSETIQEAETF